MTHLGRVWKAAFWRSPSKLQMCTFTDVEMLLAEMNLAPEMTTCYLDNVYFRKAISDNRWDKERLYIKMSVRSKGLMMDSLLVLQI